jgi:hypothetical protein
MDTDMNPALMADILVAVHVAFVAFIVLGEAAILAGAVLKWGWVSNLWFRLAHLAAIVFVALEAVFGMLCPLTRWEFELRERAGQGGRSGTFIGRILHDILYYDFPPWVFVVAYVSFALLVAATLFIVPPRWRRLPERSQ